MEDNRSFEAELNDHCSFCNRDKILNEIVHSTENFNVVMSVGQIVEGYSLIIPKDHYHCMGSLPEELRVEFLTLKSEVRRILEETYGSCIFYEHGRVGVCDVQPGEQLCYHAHLHAVPIQQDILPLMKKDLVPVALAKYEEIFDYYHRLGHYLFYEDAKGIPYIFNVNRVIRRQFLRYCAAESIGRPELADWREYPGHEEIEIAKLKLIPAFFKEVILR